MVKAVVHRGPARNVLARLEARATAEGGDMLWLHDARRPAGYRTNDAGVDALRRALASVDVLAVDLPHRGRGEVMHLLSLVSPLADDLPVAPPPPLRDRPALRMAAAADRHRPSGGPTEWRLFAVENA